MARTRRKRLQLMAIGLAAVRGFAENIDYYYDGSDSYTPEDGDTDAHEEDYVPSNKGRADNSSKYNNYTGMACKDQAYDNQLCFVGLDYTAFSLEPHEVCWAHCAGDYADSHRLFAAHARPRDNVCCCRSLCECLEIDTDTHSSLAIDANEVVSDCVDFTITGPGDDKGQDTTYQSIPGTTCGVGTATCSTIRRSNVTLCAESCGDRPAVLKGDSCCCYDECDCLESSRGSILFKRWTSKALPDCPAADRTYTAYRHADCTLKEVAATSDKGIIVGINGDKLARCADICANANESNVAAVVSPSRESCTCYTTCECISPSNDFDVALLPSSEFFTVNEDCTIPVELPEKTDFFEKYYDTYSGVRCGHSNVFVCRTDFDYDLTRSPWRLRYDCWDWCYTKYLDDFGKIEATFGDPYAGECCCASDCHCFAERNSDFSLSLLANGTKVPQHCEKDEDDDDREKVGPFHLSDVWWIVLIVIFGSVGVAFFFAVEEIDKERRNKLSKGRLRSELEPSTKLSQDSKENDRDLDK